LKTALVLALDHAPDELHDVYRSSYPDGVARGIPLHVTVLVPWVEEVDDAHLARAGRALRTVGPVEFDLVALDRFAGVLWLRPEPDTGIRALMAAVCAEYPDCKPYDGAFDDPVPHATMAVGPHVDGAPVAAELASRLASIVPVRCSVDAVAVLEQRDPPAWTRRTEIALR
jgi:hypothetical protein